jgi:hypothetical protein
MSKIFYQLPPFGSLIGECCGLSQFVSQRSEVLVGSLVGQLTVLWEQFRRPGYTVSACFNDLIQITMVMVFGWSKVPSIDSPCCQRTTGTSIFINKGLAPKGGQGVSVPFIWSIDDFICQFLWINAQCVHQMESGLYLGCYSIPQLEGKVAVSCCKRGNKHILERLVCAFAHIDVMVVWLHELQFTILLGENRESSSRTSCQMVFLGRET